MADHARHVRIEHDSVLRYAGSLPLASAAMEPDPAAHMLSGSREQLAAFWVTLGAVNFGSGWFPTLRKREGRSGYLTIAMGVRERFAAYGPWSAAELAEIGPVAVAEAVDQDPAHELMALFARSLRDLGRHVGEQCGGRFAALIDDAEGSSVALAARLSGWKCFADTSNYEGRPVPFLKRAQLTSADLARAGAAEFHDLGRLTMFADNLVPHVLRLDGILRYEPALTRRIDRRELIEHGSPEEVEIRACALQAVESIVAVRPGTRAVDVDQVLWHRGQQPAYKAAPRHRSRSTAY